jgi:hypothetical protein
LEGCPYDVEATVPAHGCSLVLDREGAHGTAIVAPRQALAQVDLLQARPGWGE